MAAKQKTNMTELIIRAASVADYAAWRPLWDGYNAFYGRSGDTALAEDITQLTWQRFLDAAEPMHVLLAERDGQLLGIVHYLFHRNTTMRDYACYLQDLYTVPAARGQGVARQLIEAVVSAARAAGSPSVYWHTHHTNHTAMQLYDKVASHSGFVLYRKTL